MTTARYPSFAIFLLTLFLVVTLGAAASQQTRVEIGNGGNFGKQLEIAAEVFMTKYPDIIVEINSGWPQDKYKVAVAVGNAPDAYVLWDAPSFAAGGYIQPLDTLHAKYGMKREDFVPAVWDMTMWRGKAYALWLQTDPNFGFVWNKNLFGEAGLNPNTAPATLQDFDSYLKRLTRYDSDGKATQIGMTPWTVFGNSNTAFTWGWIFGGEWYDYVADRATAHDARNAKALEYLTEYWERYEPSLATLGTNEEARFNAGRDAMIFATPGRAFRIMANNPEGTVGLARMFNNPDAGVKNATWVGGWGIALTSTTKVPDEAYQFMRYVTSDPDGVAAFCGGAGELMPSNIKVPYFRNLGRNPKWQAFAETIVSATKYRPAIPALGAYSGLLDQLLPRVLRREVTASAALEDLSKRIDIEMAEKYGTP